MFKFLYKTSYLIYIVSVQDNKTSIKLVATLKKLKMYFNQENS